MPTKQNKQSHSLNLYSLHLPVVALAALLLVGTALVASQTVLKNDSGDVLSKDDNKESKGKGRPDERVQSSETKNDKSNGSKSLNANKAEVLERAPRSLNKVKQEISQIASFEENLGNEEVSETLEEVAEEVDEVDEEVEEAVNQVQSRSKWQTLLVGTDYKNLGSLRSSLVKNRNTIRKLTRTLVKVEDPTSAAALQAQIDELETKQLEIKTVIETNESQFSLLGWVFKFLSGYTNTDPDVDEDTDTDTDESSESTDSGSDNDDDHESSESEENTESEE